MIRIVDILKNVHKSEEEKPSRQKEEKPPQEAKEKKPEVKLPLEDPKKAISDLLNAIKSIFSMKKSSDEADKACELILTSLGIIVDRQLSNNSNEFLDILNKTEGDEIIKEAVKTSFVSVKLGIDARYARDRLAELAAFSIFQHFKISDISPELNSKLLSETLQSKINIDSPENMKIFNLAQFYKT